MTPDPGFWAKVDRSGDCWLWLGNINPQTGYGQLTRRRVNRTPITAHRYAYLLTVGRVVDGLHVLHHCDVRACVNPAHLFLGTNLDNIADMRAKGRAVEPPHRLKTHCKHGHALTPENRMADGHGGRTQCRTCKHLWDRQSYLRHSNPPYRVHSKYDALTPALTRSLP